MEFRLISAGETEILKKAEEDLDTVLNSPVRTKYIIGGFIETECVLFVIFSMRPLDIIHANIDYMYLESEYENQGYVEQLMQYAKDFFFKKGCKTILCRIFPTEDMFEMCVQGMQKCGFLPLNMNARLLQYDYLDLDETCVVEKIMAERHKLPPTVAITKPTDIRITRLLEREKFLFDREHYDTHLSRFYVEQGEICGAMIVRKLSEREIYLSNSYLNNKAKKNGMFLILLADVLSVVQAQIGEMFRISMQIEDSNLLDNILQMFGLPAKYAYIQEWALLTD